MRCAICDKEDETVNHINTDCRECQAIITDTILSYDQDKEEESELEEEEFYDTGC
jgi:hypothetical protein